MSTKRTDARPARLKGLRRRFERWRRTRKVGTRIPEPLWAAAVKLAGRYGIHRTAKTLVEPNSALGGAISYLLRHWEKLTLFLRQAGAPLDNNLCERALKKAILHRKNALFYKTLRGARVGDLFMSLIHTCEFCGANPFEYLTELDRHAAELSSRPQDWMPWNYRQTLAASTLPSAALT